MIPSNIWRRERLIAPAVGIAAGIVVWIAYRIPPYLVSDFDHVYVGARALLRGRDPYAAVAALHERFPLLYPLPAVLLILPVAWLPVELARALWSAAGAAAFAAAAVRYGRGLWLGLASMVFVSALAMGQWSPLLTAGAVLPVASLSWVAKPTVGLALFLAYPSRRAAAFAIGLLTVSLVIEPGWPFLWLAALKGQAYLPPVLRPGGILLLLALFRYREPEGRLIAALACVPQSAMLYESLPLFLIPKTRRGGYVLAIGALLAAFAIGRWCPWTDTPPDPFAQNMACRWVIAGPLIWAPALWMALRPEEGLPALKRYARRTQGWLLAVAQRYS